MRILSLIVIAINCSMLLACYLWFVYAFSNDTLQGNHALLIHFSSLILLGRNLLLEKFFVTWSAFDLREHMCRVIIK